VTVALRAPYKFASTLHFTLQLLALFAMYVDSCVNEQPIDCGAQLTFGRIVQMKLPGGECLGEFSERGISGGNFPGGGIFCGEMSGRNPLRECRGVMFCVRGLFGGISEGNFSREKYPANVRGAGIDQDGYSDPQIQDAGLQVSTFDS